MEKQLICRNIRCSVAGSTRLIRLNLIQYIYSFYFFQAICTCSFSTISSPKCLEYGDVAAPHLENVFERSDNRSD